MVPRCPQRPGPRSPNSPSSTGLLTWRQDRLSVTPQEAGEVLTDLTQALCFPLEVNRYTLATLLDIAVAGAGGGMELLWSRTPSTHLLSSKVGTPWTPAGLLLRPDGLYSPVLVQSSFPDRKWAIWLRLKAAVWHLLEPLGIGPQLCEG